MNCTVHRIFILVFQLISSSFVFHIIFLIATILFSYRLYPALPVPSFSRFRVLTHCKEILKMFPFSMVLLKITPQDASYPFLTENFTPNPCFKICTEIFLYYASPSKVFISSRFILEQHGPDTSSKGQHLLLLLL